ncbi:type II secretion system F family protein [Streptomyces sp.]|uniref:type II secretion system F family protein n=1 Tax=Streptomyces sp. TaxID=1931 RepID=UPI002F41FEEB
MTGAAVAGALAVAIAGVEAWREWAAVRRSRSALGVRAAARRSALGSLRRVDGPTREWAPVVAAGLAVAVLVGGLLGAVAGLGAAYGARRWLERRSGAAAGSVGIGGVDPAELPLCADLMAACLAAGATPGEAAGAVGRCLGGPLGTALIRAQAEVRLGADPAECWERFGRLPTASEMGRCLARASTTGSAPVAEMSRLAADYRAAHARSALARARRAAVLATAPLGVCFLPAFLLVGVAPVVLGLAGTVLGGPAG